MFKLSRIKYIYSDGEAVQKYFCSDGEVLFGTALNMVVLDSFRRPFMVTY